MLDIPIPSFFSHSSCGVQAQGCPGALETSLAPYVGFPYQLHPKMFAVSNEVCCFKMTHLVIWFRNANGHLNYILPCL